MHNFVLYLFELLHSGLSVAALAVLVCGGVLIAVRIRKRGRLPRRKAVLSLLLAGYLAVVLSVTVLRFSGGSGVNLHLGLAWREAWNKFTLKLWLNIILNIGLFVPLGILLPLLWPKGRKWYWMLLSGFSLSLAIELMQLFAGNMTDVDDLLHNTLGAMLGWCAVMLVLELRGKRPGRAAACLILPGAVAAVFGGVFLAYELQEFGNLEFAPTFRADTSGVEWTIECALTGQNAAPVYCVEPLDRAGADAFGFDLFARIGRECPDIYYYDNQTVMGNHSGGPFLDLNWLDRTWSLTGMEAPELPDRVDETALRAELERFGVCVPEGMLFRIDGDTACLEAQMLSDGGTLYDGFIRRRVNEWGDYSLEYGLVTAELVREVEIRTPSQAARKLMDGDFYHGGWIADVEQVTVTDCRLTYMIDSKGFYQPVYTFTLVSPQKPYPYDAFVPAFF